MKVLYIVLLLLVMQSCKCRHVYRKAAKEIASQLPGNNGMNAGAENYVLFIPKGWTTKQKTVYGVNYYYLLAPKTKDDPNTNINVITEDMRQLSPQEYREKTIEYLKKVIPSATNFETGDFVAHGIEGYWYSYDMEPGGIKASMVCYIVPKNGVAYIISAGTQTKDAKGYRRLFDNVAKSFKFIK